VMPINTGVESQLDSNIGSMNRCTCRWCAGEKVSVGEGDPWQEQRGTGNDDCYRDSFHLHDLRKPHDREGQNRVRAKMFWRLRRRFGNLPHSADQSRVYRDAARTDLPLISAARASA